MALPYATENQLKQVTKSEVTKAINPILATGSIRKKPYVEKVVESLSSESLELLRETLNTNKDNVNVSLVGGSNLLKKFEKEYVGNLLTASTQVSKIYLNFGKYNTWEKVEKLSSPLVWISIMAFITSDVAEENDAAVVMIKGDTNFGEFNKIRVLAILPSTGSDFSATQVLFSWAFLGDEQEATTLAQAQGVTNFEWQGEGWYGRDYKKIEDDIFVLDDMQVQIIGQIANDDTKEAVKDFISFNKPFTPSNTQLTGHIPQVGDVVEKVYFNPNAYSTDEEWKLWYEGLKGINKKNPENKFLLSYSAETSEFTILVTNHYEFNGLDLINILLLDLGNQFLGYVTNEALTGSQSAVWTQLGVTETGWYKTGGTEQAPTFTKVSNILENSYLNATIFGIVGNEHLFSKVLSFNEEFIETPVQNLLKPNPIQVGQEVSKIYINLGYFDNDLNKMVAFGDKTLFKWQNGEDTYELKAVFHYEESDQAWTTQFDLYKNGEDSQPCVYLSQGTAIMVGGLTGKDLQEYVNKWVKIKTNAEEVEVLENQKVFELELKGTITELGDTSLISFNKSFTEIGGYIYEDVTPVTLELEKDLNQDGILIWDDTQCVLLAYYPYKNLIDIFVIDPEDYTYEKLSESATIEELRRVVFTPTQEATVVSGDDFTFKRLTILTKDYDSNGGYEGFNFFAPTKAYKELLSSINTFLANAGLPKASNFGELKTNMSQIPVAKLKQLAIACVLLMWNVSKKYSSKLMTHGRVESEGVSFDDDGIAVYYNGSDGDIIFYNYYSNDNINSISSANIVNNATFIGLDVTEVADITE